MKKKYVKVIAEFDEDGRITPIQLIWDDDRRFEISKVSNVGRVASSVGGTGYRYTITIENKERYIWLEDVKFDKAIGARWFIEIRE